MHQILQSLLIREIFILTILVDFDNGTTNNEGSVIAHSLETFLVLAISEFRVKILIDFRLF
jgi:hypothetical protein